MTRKPIRCDIFCAVVDNYGDAAVCWRLACQLAIEHGWRVRLWMDDLAPLHQLAPDYAAGPVAVRPWPAPAPWPADDTAEVVIEAFACEPPPAYIEAMAGSARAPVWLNLEYLSAESWVADSHGLPSPHPRLPLLKHFYFPGFAAGTGGLLRERDYDSRRSTFDEMAFRAEFALPPRLPGELTVSLFSYPNPALADLIRAWVAWASPERPLRVLRPGSKEAARTIGHLSLQPLPFLPQRRYDELLWACDLNFVRGEDSFVRAQWAARPFIWQIYPQAEDAHLVKLEAFLALHPAGAALRPFWLAWNGIGSLDWPTFATGLPALEAPSRHWAKTLASRPDLASGLVKFCLERLK
ncbi:elongation factor P maturation arginine rhamnosyltransferase EarP [Sulfuritalea sp.]|uniref:elongation factor P maturation arginine rhamnosyltransferase EarP n=1 Tax=Sulfuritalea sp. TaxID=2480090 RepID=UPI00286E8D1C|nr:elongation factor P maturation arginine rhamnosyltransferase EarP [Sulfuritalea sp.]